ncbi:MAG: DUF2480 family protein [Sediminibacterium sp.]|jgi:hypothetical protein|nr:DUF2480 family protein [Sediminibacterium sp.]
MQETFVNKVAESGLITIDLETFLPKEEILVFDIKNYLFMELILKEKDFRKALQEHDWNQYKDRIVAVTCSVDAIIPVWAYMLIISYLEPFSTFVHFGNKEQCQEAYLIQQIKQLDQKAYTDQRVVVKGCGETPIPASAYFYITSMLRPVAKSIMYGEPCSTVPVFKKKAN